MSESEPRPFVPRHGRVDDRRPPTPDELAQMREAIREGAAKLPRPKTKTAELTDAESAARARAKLDRRKP